MEYVIDLNYVTTYRTKVETDGDEGTALALAREKAEDADMNEFVIKRELEANIVSRQ